MELLDILQTFNSVNNTNFSLIKRDKIVSSFSPGLKEQTIQIIDYNNNTSIFIATETSILDMSSLLEEKVLLYLLNYRRSIYAIDLATIPKGISIQEFIDNRNKYPEVTILETKIYGR